MPAWQGLIAMSRLLFAMAVSHIHDNTFQGPGFLPSVQVGIDAYSSVVIFSGQVMYSGDKHLCPKALMSAWKSVSNCTDLNRGSLELRIVLHLPCWAPI